MSKKQLPFFIIGTILTPVLVGLFPAESAFAEITCLTTQIEAGEDPSLDTDCNSTPSQLKKYLLDSGYSESSAAGIMGNIRGESRYRTKIIEGGQIVNEDFRAYTNGERSELLYKVKEDGTRKNKGFGLAQWTTDGRLKNLQSYADSMSLPVTSVEAQAGFLVKELKEKYNMKPDTLNAMSLEEVVWVILRDFETPFSVACEHSKNEDCGNNINPRHKSLSEILADPSNYAMAISSYNTRLGFAKSAKDFDISDCDGSSEDPADPSTPTDPSTSSDPSTPSTPGTPTGNTSGALGKQSSSGFYAQCAAGNASIVWRKDGSSLCSSGCSMVAVANSAKYLGVTPNALNTIANWTKTAISNENDTGWNGSVSRTISHLGMKWNGSYLWSSHTVSTDTKISKIRQVLAGGGAVIAAGARTKNNPYASFYASVNCSSSTDKNAGKCVFSNNGHFVTIIGITADNKLIIANAANGKNGTSSNDKLNADNVLKASNKAIGVYK